MKLTEKEQQRTKKQQKQTFKITLTVKQLMALSKLLPLNYSLQPQKTKRGIKPLKQTLKGNKRSNLSSSQQLNNLPNAEDSTGLLTVIDESHEGIMYDKELQQYDERPIQTSDKSQSKQKVNSLQPKQWMRQFLANCNSVPIIKKTFETTLTLLSEKVEANSIQQIDFHQTIANMISNQNKKHTKKGKQLTDKIKKIYAKYTKRMIIEQKKHSIQQDRDCQSISKSDTRTNKKAEVTSKSQSKRKSSSSSSDLGFDMSIIDFSKLKSSQETIKYDEYFINAAFVSRNLRKIPIDQALQILSKYGVTAIDLLKIKSLSKVRLQELRSQVKSLKKKYPSKISDSQNDKDSYVQSSFQVQDD